MQVCTSLQTDNHANTPPLSFLQAGCPSCRPTNSVKALKASAYLLCVFLLVGVSVCVSCCLSVYTSVCPCVCVCVSRCLASETECDKLRERASELRRKVEDMQAALLELGRENQSLQVTMRHDTRFYFNVRSKADISQLNLPHGTDN